MVLAFAISALVAAFLSLMPDSNLTILVVAWGLSFSVSYLLITITLEFLVFREIGNIYSLLEKIQKIAEISECYIITGEADFLMKVVCKDLHTYEQLLFKTLSQIDEIERLKTLMTLSTVKESKVLPFDYEQDM